MNDQRPVFSVIIPLFNKAAYIARCLNSVLNQTWQVFEILVVDDGSTDNGSDIVLAIEDPRLRLIRQENQGVSRARNRGASEASTDLLAFLDADDEWLPRFLESVADLANRYADAGAYGTACWFLRRGGWVRFSGNRRALDGKFEGMVTNYFRGGHILWCGSAVVRKKVFEQAGGFDPQLKNGQDQDLWFKIAAISAFAYTNDPQVIWHIKVTDSLSGSGTLSFRTQRLFPNSDWLLRMDLPEARKAGILYYVRRSVASLMLVSASRGYPDYAENLLDEYVVRHGRPDLLIRVCRQIARSTMLSKATLSCPRIVRAMHFLWYTYCRPPAWLAARRIP
jgi:glycosyltransferase involved in cell wall biosynthesis